MLSDPRLITPGPFIAQTPYEAEHPDALALYCSDGRFTEAVEELFAHLGYPRLDTLTLPGGPGLLNSWTSNAATAAYAVRASAFLIRAHHIRHVVLIAHEGCGYYRDRYRRSAQEIPSRQLDDLKAAARELAIESPRLETSLYFASIAGARVVFSPVAR